MGVFLLALRCTSSSDEDSNSTAAVSVPDSVNTLTVGTDNETSIIVRGSHIEHWMNGTKLLEADIGSDTWNERVEGTKFANWPRFAQAETGHIALQDHGYPVWYRDIKLRSLSVDPE